MEDIMGQYPGYSIIGQGGEFQPQMRAECNFGPYSGMPAPQPNGGQVVLDQNGQPAVMGGWGCPYYPVLNGPASCGPNGYPVARGAPPGYAAMAGAPSPYAAMGNGSGPGYGYDPYCLGPGVVPHLVQQVQEPALFLQPQCPRVLRTELFGFHPTKIPGCGFAEVCATAQIIMKLIRLTVDSNAFQLLIHQIEIGKECLINGGPIPAEMLLYDANDALQLNFPTLQVGTQARIRLENRTNAEVCVAIGAWARVAY